MDPTRYALPMPLNSSDPGIALALKASDVVDALDQQFLKVTGLKAAQYKLAIDDEPVGSFSREQLAQGVISRSCPHRWLSRLRKCMR